MDSRRKVIQVNNKNAESKAFQSMSNNKEETMIRQTLQDISETLAMILDNLNHYEEPPHGTWLLMYDDSTIGLKYTCSKCGAGFVKNPGSRCPQCNSEND